MKYIRFQIVCLVMCISFSSLGVANEVIPKTDTEVIIRHHPKTDIPYVSIVGEGEKGRKDLQTLNPQKYDRPDYRLLDPNVRSKDIDYDGPYSSKKKIYIFAASLATLGTAGAVVGAAVFPATAATAASGAGAGTAAGAVAVTGLATAAATIKINSEIPEDYVRIQETTLLAHESDFYKMHILKQEG